MINAISAGLFVIDMKLYKCLKFSGILKIEGDITGTDFVFVSCMILLLVRVFQFEKV